MKKEKKNIMVTGCAGFIGFHLCLSLLKSNIYNVYGIDNLNNYYSTKLKTDRLNILKKKNKRTFKFHKIDISNFSKINQLFKKVSFDIVINLAAQAELYSIQYPDTYYKNNIKGFYNILNLSKNYKISHLLFASTSSVYGDNKNYPLNEEHNTDRPLSFYAATKKCNEVMAFSYSNIYDIPITAMRFFTVYGPMGY